MELIEPRYHPRNAVKGKRIGNYTLHGFRNGAALVVKRGYVKKLFGSEWQKGEPLRARTNTEKVEAGKEKLVVRRYLTQANNMLTLYNRLHRIGVKFEPPVAWLSLPGKRRVITRFVEGYREYSDNPNLRDVEFANTVLKNAAFELGKMHGVGVSHGHPHNRNILVNNAGDVVLIDPKFMKKTNREPEMPLHRLFRYKPTILTHFVKNQRRKGELHDLAWFLELTTQLPPETMQHAGFITKEQLGEAYRRGVRYAKRITKQTRKKQR